MKNRKGITLIISVVFGFVLLTIIILKPSAQILNQQSPQDDATVVQRGQITDKEREYGKEYRQLYSSRRRAFTFTELINKSIQLRKTNELIRILFEDPEIPDDPRIPILPPLQLFSKLSCKSDAVVLGSVRNKTAHITDDETIIYTEYQFSVQNVLKNNSVSPIPINNNLDVTRPGGTIILDGRRIDFDDKLYERLNVNQSYILFLKFVPSVGGYEVASWEGDFALENNTFRTISKARLAKEISGGNNIEALLADIGRASSANCSEVK